MKDEHEDPLRALVARAVAEGTSAVQQLAVRAGVSDETIYALLRGGRVGKGSRRLIEDAVKNPDRPSPAPPSPAADGTPAGDGGLITIPRDQFFELRGELRGLQRLMLWAAESAMQMHKHLGDAAGGVGDMVASGMFTRPDIPPLPMTRLDPPDDEAEEARRVG